MKKENFTEFIESFCIAQSLNIECSFLCNEKKDFYEIRLPKLLSFKIHILSPEVVVIMDADGGLGSYAKFDSFVENLTNDEFLLKMITSHKYSIAKYSSIDMDFEECINLFINHINFLIN